MFPVSQATRNSLTFVNTTVIASGKKAGWSLKTLVYVIVVVSTNVRELRVVLIINPPKIQRRFAVLVHSWLLVDYPVLVSDFA